MRGLIACFALLAVMTAGSVYGQCLNCTAPYSGTVFSNPAADSSWTPVADDVNAGQYLFFNVVAGTYYEWATCGSVDPTFNPELSLLRRPSAPYTYSCDSGIMTDSVGVAYNNYSSDCTDNAQSMLMAKIGWYATFTGTVVLLVNRPNCQTTSIAPSHVSIKWHTLSTPPEYCTNCENQNPATVQSNPAEKPSWTTVATNMSGGDYALFNVVQGTYYEWSTCAGSGWDTQITLRRFDCLGEVLGYNNDYTSDPSCGTRSRIGWFADFTGTIAVIVSQNYCQSNTAADMTLQWRKFPVTDQCSTCTTDALGSELNIANDNIAIVKNGQYIILNNVEGGATYEFSACHPTTGFDTQLTLRGAPGLSNPTCTSPLLAYNDNGDGKDSYGDTCGERSKIVWTAPENFNGTDEKVLLAVHEFNCQADEDQTVWQLRTKKIKRARYTELVLDATLPFDIVVNDNTTNLLWTKAIASGHTWVEALSYCSLLDYAGKDDWRLPTINELVSIVDFNLENPATSMPAIASGAEEWFWSSTTYLGSPDPNDRRFAWVVNLQDGRNYMDAKADFPPNPLILYDASTICVRDTGLIGVHFDFSKNDFAENEPVAVTGWTCDKSFYHPDWPEHRLEPLPNLWVYITVTDKTGTHTWETPLILANKKLTLEGSNNCGPNGDNGYDFSYDLMDPANKFEGEIDNIKTVLKNYILSNLQNPAPGGQPPVAIQPFTISVYALPLQCDALGNCVPITDKNSPLKQLLWTSPKYISLFYDSTDLCGDGYLQSGEICDPVQNCLFASDQYNVVCPGPFDLYCANNCAGPAGACSWHCCGDNTVDYSFGEVCEEDATCDTIPHDPPYYAGDTAYCSSDCASFDLDECKWCGDGLVTNGENCDPALSPINCNTIPHDPAYYNTEDAPCRTDCAGYDTSVCRWCGDGIVSNGELCDSSQDCSFVPHAPPYYSGDLAGCNSTCTTIDNSQCKWCGDALITNGETCDSNSQSCDLIAHFPPYYASSTAACLNLSSPGECGGFTETTCTYCGDGILQWAEGEICDNNTVNCSVMPHTPAYYNADSAPCTNLITAGDCSSINTTSCKWCGDGLITAGNLANTMGLVMNLELDETSGTTATDSSGNGNHGTLLNDAGWVIGKHGNAITLDGTDDFVSVPHSPSLNIGGAITIELWLYNALSIGPAETRYIFGKGASTAYAASWDRATGVVTFRLNLGGVARTLDSSANKIGVNQWHHWAFVYDGAHMMIYRDGLLDTIASYSGALGQTGNDLYLGGDPVGAGRFQGNIDAVRIYDRALSASDIRANMGEICDSDTQNCQSLDPRYYNTQSVSCTDICDAYRGANLLTGPYDWTNLANWLVTGSGALVWDGAENALKATNAVTIRLSVGNRLPIDTSKLYYLAYDVMVRNKESTARPFSAGALSYSQVSGGVNLRTDYFGHSQYDIPEADTWYSDRINVAIGGLPKTGESSDPTVATRWASGTTHIEIAFILNEGGSGGQETYIRNLRFYEYPCRWCGDGTTSNGEACDAGLGSFVYCHTLSHTPAYYDDTMTASCAADCSTAVETDCNYCGDGAVTDYWDRDTRLLMHFNENTGSTAYDWSGNAFNGIITGATWTSGMFGSKALSFAGGTNKVQLTNPVIPASTEAFTISAWIYPTTASVGYIAGNYGTGNPNGIELYKTATNQLAFRYAGATCTSAAGAIALNAWNHVAATRDASGTKRAFVNGVQVCATSDPSPVTAALNFAIGNGPDYTTDAFVGKIDEVKVYLRALSDAELAKPALLFSFDENQGTTVYDLSGNELHGTVTGAARSTGKVYRALEFDTIDDKLTIPSTTVLPAGTGAFTISAWILPSTDGTNDYIVGNYSSSTNPNGLLFYRNSSGRLALRLGGQTVTSNGTIPSGTWSHVAVRKYAGTSSSNTHFYINGVLDKDNATLNAAGGITLGANWTVGNGFDYSDDFFSGSIDSLRIDARAFSDTEMRMLSKEFCDTAGPSATQNCRAIDAIYYDTDTVSCTSDCLGINTENCKWCGDSQVTNGETCDTNSVTCDTLSHTPPYYNTQTASCRNIATPGDCSGFDESLCRWCGDSLVSNGEVCDNNTVNCSAVPHTPPYYSTPTASCLNIATPGNCSGFDVSGCRYCGDALVTHSEACDTNGATATKNCHAIDPNYYDTDLVSCKNDCTGYNAPTNCKYCGNGTIENRGSSQIPTLPAMEACDPPTTCAHDSADYFATCPGPSDLLCSADCTAQTPCTWRCCGDNIVDADDGEKCDGTAGGGGCENIWHRPRYYVGPAGDCKSDCSGWTFGHCDYCGDDIVQASYQVKGDATVYYEQCDGDNKTLCIDVPNPPHAYYNNGAKIKDCRMPVGPSYSFTPGYHCMIVDDSDCEWCGDGKYSPSYETCDTVKDNGVYGDKAINCTDSHFLHSPAYYNTENATCIAGCQSGYDTSACRYCGDGTVSNGETCDMGTVNCSTLSHTPAYYNTETASCRNSMLLWYNLDEGVGTAISDSSGNGNTGLLTGGTWTTGRYGNAVNFAATSDKIQLSVPILSGTAPFTISAHIYYTTAAVGYIAGNYSSNNANGIRLSKDASHKLLVRIAGTTHTSSGSLTPSAWNHVVVTRTATGTVTLYINGTASGTFVNPGAITTSRNFTVGNGPDYTTDHFVGIIDEVRVYPRALTAGEIANDTTTCAGYDESNCKWCGDTLITNGEACDGNTVNCNTVDPKYYNTENADCLNLSTPGNCTGFNVTNCKYCGDGLITNSETCDGNTVNCNSLDPKYYPTQNASCRNLSTPGDCAGFDVSNCRYCGDGIVSNGEVCDTAGPTATKNCHAIDVNYYDTFTVNCKSDCSGYEPPTPCTYCGNGTVESRGSSQIPLLPAIEACDPPATCAHTPADYFLTCPTVSDTSCSADCTSSALCTWHCCGDNVVDSANGEQCDGTAGGGDCESVPHTPPYYAGASGECRNIYTPGDCTGFVGAGCTWCGDGILQATYTLGGNTYHEQCEDGLTILCKDVPFPNHAYYDNGATIKGCNMPQPPAYSFTPGVHCMVSDDSDCRWCGDGYYDAAYETCDTVKNDMQYGDKTVTCDLVSHFPPYYGTDFADCLAGCQTGYDTTSCKWCGDSTITNGEFCDGNTVNCSAVAHTPSYYDADDALCKNLATPGDCTGLDTTACKWCGDGLITAGNLGATSGLVMQLMLNETSGTTAPDSSGNGNNGTLTNGPTWVGGKYGNAVQFDGTNDYIAVNDSPSLDFTTGFTAEMWIYNTLPFSAGTANKWIFGKGQGDSYSAYWDKSTGYVYFRLFISGALRTLASSKKKMGVNVWQHWAFTYDGTTGVMKIYVDGELDTTATYVGAIGTNDNALRIGSDVTGGTYFQGKIDAVRFYNRELSAEEIRSNMGEYCDSDTKSCNLIDPKYYATDSVSCNATCGDYQGANLAAARGWTNPVNWTVTAPNGGTLEWDAALSALKATGYVIARLNINNRIPIDTNKFYYLRYDIMVQNKDVTARNFYAGTLNYNVATGGSNLRTDYFGHSDYVIPVENEWYTDRVNARILGVPRYGTSFDPNILEAWPIGTTHAEIYFIFNNGAPVGSTQVTYLRNLAFYENPCKWCGDKVKNGTEACDMGLSTSVYCHTLTHTPAYYADSMTATCDINCTTSTETGCNYCGDGAVTDYWDRDARLLMHLNENNGVTAYDWSGNTFNGTVTGATWTTGIGGTAALSFAGGTDKVQLSVPILPSGTGVFTLSAWVYPTDLSADRTIAGNYSSAVNANGTQFYLNTAGNLVLRLAGVTAVSTGVVPLNQWTHVAVVRAGTGANTTRFYINGAQDSTGTLAGSATTSANFAIGNTPNSTTPFVGKIDEVKVYLRDIGSTELTKKWLSLSFDEGTGTTAYDASGNELHATLVNGAGWTTDAKSGNAVTLDGTNDYVSVPNAVNPTDKITVAAWVKSSSPTGYGGTYQFVSKYNAFALGTATAGSNVVRFQVYTAGSWKSSGDYTIPDPQNWHYIVGTYDSTASTNRLRIYVDGILRKYAVATVDPINADSGPTHIGHRENAASGTDHLGGIIDKVEIWPRALGANEILYNMQPEGCDTVGPSSSVSCASLPHTPTYYSDNFAACDSSCRGYDASNCRYCGDGLVTNSEACDTSGATATVTCDTRPHSPAYYNTENATCNGDCMSYNESACRWCGDGAITNGETCDSNTVNCSTVDAKYYNTETAGCLNLTTPGTCSGFNVSNCKYCGDGLLTNGETCDPTKPGSAVGDAVIDCHTLNSAYYAGNNAVCRSDCTGYDVSACRYCGDTLITNGEACDPLVNCPRNSSDYFPTCANPATDRSCTDACMTSTACSWRCCGDNVTDAGDGEICDGTAGGGECEGLPHDPPYYAGSGITCNSTCSGFSSGSCPYCGDGTVQADYTIGGVASHEQCDGATLCTAVANPAHTYYDNGASVTCVPGSPFTVHVSCTVQDDSACRFCGDSQVTNGETCDRSSINCSSLSHTPAYYNTETAWCKNRMTAWYELNAGAGSAANDSSGNALHGTITGATWTNAGKYGKALSFDGSGDYVEVADNVLLEPTNVTISLWVNPTVWAGSYRTLIAKRSASGDGYLIIYLTTTNTINWDWGGSTNRWDTGYLPPLGQWTKLTFTRDASGRKLYVNDVLYASGPAGNSTLVPSTAPLRVGTDSAAAQYSYSGLIDDVRIYSRAQNATEVASEPANCTGYDESICRYCGDNIISNGELCDGNSVNCSTRPHSPAYYNTENTACMNTTVPGNCAAFNESTCRWCGDGLITNGETCDNNSVNCNTVDPKYYNTENAACLNVSTPGNCTGFNVTNCKYCGDSIISNGELCDGNSVNCSTRPHSPAYYNTENATCMNATVPGNCATFNESACRYCGDGLITNGETCDNNTVNCNTLSHTPPFYATGTATCLNVSSPGTCSGFNTANCRYCGDGIYTAGFETCDPTAPGGALGGSYVDCHTLDSNFYSGTNATCNSDCGGYDTSACRRCGDAIYSPEAPFGESCDTALGGSTYGAATIPCQTYNASYYNNGQNATCNAGCLSGYNTSNCRWCGDSLVSNGETCDTAGATATVTCDTIPHAPSYYNTQNATCNTGCFSGYNESACKFCGDLSVTNGEICDGNNKLCSTITHSPAYYADGTYADCKNRVRLLFHLDEGSGTTATDTSGYGTNGTISGATWTTAGKYGKALTFDGTDDRITWTYDTTPANNFTIEAWVKPTTTHEIDAEATSGTTGVSGQRYLFWPNSGGASNSYVGISVGTNGVSVYEHGDAYMPALAVYSGTISSTDWTRITVTYINKQPRIYVNGTLVRTGLTSPRTNVYAPNTLGGGAYGYFPGGIDEVRVYHRALTDAEVAANNAATFCAGWDESVCNWCGDGRVNNGETCDTSGATATVDCSTRSHSPSYYSGNNATCSSCTSYNESACKWCGDGLITNGEICDNNSVSCSSITHNPPYYNVTTGQCKNMTTPGDCSGINEANCRYCGDGITTNAAEPTISGTLRHYKFEETSGTTATDSSGNGVNGTLANGPVWTSDGKFGRALNFDSTNDYVSFSTTGFSNNAGTIEYWFKPVGWNGGDGSYHGAFQTVTPGSWGNQAGQMIIINQWSNTFYFRYVPDGGCCATDVTFPTAGVFTNGVWTHIAVVWNKAANTLSVYVNGALKASRSDWTTAISTPIGATAYIGVGHDRYGGGIFDEFKLYNRALSANEIRDKALELHLDEGSGTKAYDSSGNNLDGTINGSPVLTNLGKYGKAVTFDGVNDYIALGNPAALQITGDQTIMMWINPDNFSARRNPYDKAYGGEGTITLETNGRLNYYYGIYGGNGGTYQGFTSSAALTAGTWNFIAIVRNLSTMTLTWYVNGVSNSTAASYAPAVASSNPVRIGLGYTGNYFAGKIDEVRVFRRALSSSEINAYYTQTADAYEGCDNGSGVNTDAMCGYNLTFVDCPRCHANCQGTFQGAQWCGDGILQSGNGENCDLGAANSSNPCPWQQDPYSCGTACSTTCQPATAQYCGDNITQGPAITGQADREVCDKGPSSPDLTKACNVINASYYPVGIGTCNSVCTGYDVASCKRCGDGTISTVATTSGLVMRLNFDEGSGATAYDTSPLQRNHATVVGWPWTGDVPNAKYRYAHNYTSTGTYAYVNDSYGDLTLGTVWTLEAWLKYSGTSRQRILGKGAWQYANYALAVEDSTTGYGTAGHLLCVFDSTAVGGGMGVHTPLSYADNQWHYVVCTYDGAYLRIYVDGYQKDVKSYTGTPRTDTSPFYVGGYHNMGYAYYTGMVDEVRIYKGVALNASQIQQNWDLRNYHESCDLGASNGCASTCGTDCQPRTADYCGNNLTCTQRGEVCDGSDLSGQSCLSLTGYTTGSISCNAGCGSFNTSGCYTCGNGAIEGPEICDVTGPNLGGQSCTTRPAISTTVTFNYTGSIVTWTAPATTTYRIEAYGAQGGSGYAGAGGLGARMRGDFSLTAGTVLKILVGQQGGAGSYVGGGGGGSFVTNSSNSPYIIAGGGGGMGYYNSCGLGGRLAGTTSTTGQSGYDEYNCNDGGAGGAGPNGGGYDSSYGYSVGSGGGGLTGNGSSYQGAAYAGKSFTNGGAGGSYYGDGSGSGGFGGGGGGEWYNYTGGGGGGGYGGGGGGSYWGGGGGGGSYNAGSNQSNSSGVRAGNGLVTITYTANFAGGTLGCSAGCMSFNTSSCYLCGDGNITTWSGETCDNNGSNNDGGASGAPGTCWTNCTKWNPKGSHDSATTTSISGWACDEDRPSTNITLHVYFYDKNWSQLYVKGITTGVSRPDVQAAGHCTAISTHGWQFNPQADSGLWTALYNARANRPFTVRPYALNVPTAPPGTNPNLGDKTIGGYCGDGAVQSEFSEVCDSGTNHCKRDCSGVGVCGDGNVDFQEVCDGSNFGGLTCASYGFTGGSLSCSSCTSISTAGCYKECTFSIYLYDSYGDGWNGAYVDVTSAGILRLDNYGSAFTSGYGYGWGNFTVRSGANLTIAYPTGGSYPSECSFLVRNAANGGGSDVVQTSSDNPPQGYSGTVTCP